MGVPTGVGRTKFPTAGPTRLASVGGEMLKFPVPETTCLGFVGGPMTLPAAGLVAFVPPNLTPPATPRSSAWDSWPFRFLVGVWVARRVGLADNFDSRVFCEFDFRMSWGCA